MKDAEFDNKKCFKNESLKIKKVTATSLAFTGYIAFELRSSRKRKKVILYFSLKCILFIINFFNFIISVLQDDSVH